MISRVAAVWFAFVLPAVVVAWGEYGHEIVANVAWNRLSVTAKDSITALLNVTNATLILETGSPLAAVANWADHVRYFKPWSGGLHYIDVRDDALAGGCHYHSPHADTMATSRSETSPVPCDFHYKRDCPNDYCVAGAILNYSSQLLHSRSPNRSLTTYRSSLRSNHRNDIPSSVREALMFLIHFIGDIHQPLHVSRASDKGGNDIHVVYHLLDAKSPTTVRHSRNDDRSQDGFTTKSAESTTSRSHHHHHSWNLHSVWDTALIETALERDYVGQRSKLELELLHLLHDHPEWVEHYLGCAHGSGARNSTCVQEWGEESWHLALEFAYTKNVPEQEGGVVVEVADGDELEEDYYTTRLPVVKERLMAGGVRLASTLEDIFGTGDAVYSDAAEHASRVVHTKNLVLGLGSLRMCSFISSML